MDQPNENRCADGRELERTYDSTSFDEQVNDKAFVMTLLKEAEQRNLRLEALSVITSNCTSNDRVDWTDMRQELQELINSAPPTKTKSFDQITFGTGAGFAG